MVKETISEVERMSNDVMIVVGAGQISMAIARRIGYGKKSF